MASSRFPGALEVFCGDILITIYMLILVFVKEKLTGKMGQERKKGHGLKP
jgi:hypothetical protein